MFSKMAAEIPLVTLNSPIYRKSNYSKHYLELYGEDIHDFQILKSHLSSSASGISISRENTPLDSFVGLGDVKKELLQNLLAAILIHPDNERKRFLVYGATGTGKDHLVRAIATAINATLIRFKPFKFSFFYKWDLNLEAYTRAIYEICREQDAKPAILYIKNVDLMYVHKEEIQAMIRFFREVQNEWAKNIEADKNKDSICELIIMATTYSPNQMEEEMVRLFGNKIHVPTLNLRERKQVLEKIIEKYWKHGHEMSSEEIGRLAEKYYLVDTYGIQRMVFDAIDPLCMRPLKAEDFDGRVPPCYKVSSKTFNELANFHQKFGGGRFMRMIDREYYNFDEDDDEEGNGYQEQQKKKSRQSWVWQLLCCI